MIGPLLSVDGPPRCQQFQRLPPVVLKSPYRVLGEGGLERDIQDCVTLPEKFGLGLAMQALRVAVNSSDADRKM
jgi:hypothetical protein